MKIKELVSKQREYFRRGKSLDINFREEGLIKLKEAIKSKMK
jgi:hypothetical protein